MKIILLLFCILFTTANMDMISTSGLSLVLISLMPLQSWSFPLDTLEEDVGLMPTRVPKTYSPYAPTTRAPDWERKLKKSYKECEVMTGISNAQVKQFRMGIWKKTPLTQEWALCILNKMDLMTMQGVFRFDTALEYIRRDVGHGAAEVKRASALVNNCLTHKLLTPEQIAWEYLRCHRKSDTKKKYPSLGILLESDLRKKKKVVMVTIDGNVDPID